MNRLPSPESHTRRITASVLPAVEFQPLLESGHESANSQHGSTNSRRRHEKTSTMEERDQVAALTVVFGLTLAVVYAVGDPFLWVSWSIVMVTLSGAVLIRLNR